MIQSNSHEPFYLLKPCWWFKCCKDVSQRNCLVAKARLFSGKSWFNFAYPGENMELILYRLWKDFSSIKEASPCVSTCWAPSEVQLVPLSVAFVIGGREQTRDQQHNNQRSTNWTILADGINLKGGVLCGCCCVCCCC